MKSRLTVPAKVRALLQQEIDSLCPFCGSHEVAHFQIHHIDEDPCNNDSGNLLMICATCHSKITKGDIARPDVYRKKLALRNKTRSNKIPMPPRQNVFLASVHDSVIGDNTRVILNVRTVKKEKYPPGCIGYDVAKANYVSYLIGRYHEFKQWDVGKDAMNYAILSSSLKNKFKIGAARSIYNLPVDRFNDLIREIHFRIDGTKLGGMKRGERLYESFDDYVSQHVTTN